MGEFGKFKDAISPFLQHYGISGGLLILLAFVLYVAATKPENFKIYFGFIYNLISGPFAFVRKKAIRFQIEGPATKALKKFSSELGDINIPELSIKWVNADNFETKLKEGKAIIKLKFQDDQTRNILKATSIYVRDAFLNHSKPYIHDSFKKALDLIITKKILLSLSKNRSNLVTQFFEENTIDDNVFEKCEKIQDIDDNGLLTRILIREIHNFGNKLLGRIPKEEYKNESEHFLDYIDEIAIRGYDEDTPLAFNEDTLKVAVILVAKKETYQEHGIEPYLRRIKLVRAQGVESIYLLGRSEKVEILIKVASELLLTGNFILCNKPKEYNDSKGRKSICYAIKINEDSAFANTLAEIGTAIKTKSTVKGVIVGVRQNSLKVDIYGVEGIVKKEQLSVLEITDPSLYFREGALIELQPLEILQDGLVEFTLKNTVSDPNHLVTSNFQIGKKVFGRPTYIDDEFIKVNIGHDKIEGIAFRKDLTFSRFIFLHKKFNTDADLEFEILAYNFEKASVILKLSQLTNPWSSARYSSGQSVDFEICKKNPRSFVGEIAEGIEAVLPFSELAWVQSDIATKSTELKRGTTVRCKVKNIDHEDNVIILTLKDQDNNPYVNFININRNSIFDFIIEETNNYGLTGKLVGSDLTVYVPNYETSWGGKAIKYNNGSKWKVSIKDIDQYQTKLIGSFKPILSHPLQDFQADFKAGDIILSVRFKKSYNWGIVYTMTHKGKIYEGILLRQDISNYAWIDDCKIFKSSLNNLPMAIKNIDMDENKIFMSLKLYSKSNIANCDSLDYASTYEGIILGKLKFKKNYALLLINSWAEGILETNLTHDVGAKIEVRPGLVNDHQITLIED